jgi:DNA ligase-1
MRHRVKNDPVVAVPTYSADNQEELDEQYAWALEDNFEGQMVRTNDTYEFKRSASLLKRKEFTDKEYEIVFVGEGKGNKTGTVGYMTLRREDGVEFSSNVKGTDEYRKDLLEQADKLVGKWATCKYFNLTPDGIPRFPFVVAIRDGVGID